MLLLAKYKSTEQDDGDYDGDLPCRNKECAQHCPFSSDTPPP
jgi:hypothetical protein